MQQRRKRGANRFEEMNVTYCHIPGRENVIADGLSLLPLAHLDPAEALEYHRGIDILTVLEVQRCAKKKDIGFEYDTSKRLLLSKGDLTLCHYHGGGAVYILGLSKYSLVGQSFKRLRKINHERFKICSVRSLVPEPNQDIEKEASKVLGRTRCMYGTA